MEPTSDKNAAPIVLPGPENVLAVCFCGRRKSYPAGVYRLARFLVIAAPRPSGSPDLETIQAGLTGGRFFLCSKESRARFGGPRMPPYIREGT